MRMAWPSSSGTTTLSSFGCLQRQPVRGVLDRHSGSGPDAVLTELVDDLVLDLDDLVEADDRGLARGTEVDV
jgi:hypothetical protein